MATSRSAKARETMKALALVLRRWYLNTLEMTKRLPMTAATMMVEKIMPSTTPMKTLVLIGKSPEGLEWRKVLVVLEGRVVSSWGNWWEDEVPL